MSTRLGWVTCGLTKRVSNSIHSELGIMNAKNSDSPELAETCLFINPIDVDFATDSTQKDFEKFWSLEGISVKLEEKFSEKGKILF